MPGTTTLPSLCAAPGRASAVTPEIRPERIDLEHHVTRPTLSEQSVFGEKFHGASHEFWTRTVKPR